MLPSLLPPNLRLQPPTALSSQPPYCSFSPSSLQQSSASPSSADAHPLLIYCSDQHCLQQTAAAICLLPAHVARRCHLAAFFKSAVSHRCSAAIAVAPAAAAAALIGRLQSTQPQPPLLLPSSIAAISRCHLCLPLQCIVNRTPEGAL
ncbi:hypothetical protein BHE74_00020511 [Ensete ventricosum]|nr:hypothetical protein BHE74_00020511 [Ensete ventricosum]